jgi:hypothetical protein
MIRIIIVILASVIPVAPIAMYFMNRYSNNPVKTAKDLVLVFKGYNFVLALMALGIGIVWLVTPQTVLAAGSLPLRAATDPYASLPLAFLPDLQLSARALP